MKKELENMQDAVNSINITEAMQKEIIQRVENATKRKKFRFSNVAVAAGVIVILSGVLSVPVRAFVNSLIQERMEQVPEEELTALTDDLKEQKVGGDSFSRAYTEEEERKMAELAQKYQEGTFPEGELVQTESVEEAKKIGFCFLVTDSTFYLPDRELTEEEMLQIIDFYAKRDYALAEQYREEHADEIAKQKENEEQKKAEAIESGGITEEESVEIAQEWLIKIYGVTEEGLEIDHYFSDDAPVAGKREIYHVNWRDFSNQQNYSFWIAAKDGSLVYTARTGRNVEKEAFAVTEADALLPELKQSAALFTKEQLQQNYKDVYCAYYSVNDVLNGSVSFIFVREDNSVFTLAYDWNGKIKEFQESQFSTYEEEYEDMKESAEAAEYYKHKGDETEINWFFEKIEGME